MNKRPPAQFYAGDLFGEIYQAHQAPPRQTPLAALPGLAVCATAALAAAWLANSYGFPIILLGLLVGLALSFLSEDARTHAGLDFASRHFLRAGIVLLGLQVTAAQVLALGWVSFVALLAVMAVAMLAGVAAARLAGEPREAGVLAGGATAICGASAALALYGVIGQNRLSRERFSVTLVGVALASAIAMASYPLIASVLGFTDSQAGFLIGASVHDAAQAIGGAFAYSDAAGQDATIVKLARVAMLAPVVALVAVWLGRGGGKNVGRARWTAIAVPWFILGFLALVTVNSIVQLPPGLADIALTTSKGLLLLAVTAAAMRSRLGLLVAAGWRPLVPVFAASFASFIAALTAAALVID
ncbi:MAG: YeiH family protein [Qipengyuania sp.]